MREGFNKKVSTRKICEPFSFYPGTHSTDLSARIEKGSKNDHPPYEKLKIYIS